jgi:hypothetical protein
VNGYQKKGELMKKTGLGLMAFLCAGGVLATVVLKDHFEMNVGPLNRRTPDSGSGAWSASNDLVVENGMLMSAAKLTSGWFALPEISPGDVIKVSAVIVGNVTENTEWVGIGLMEKKGAVYKTGAPYFTMKNGTDGLGYLMVYGGEGRANEINQNKWLREKHGYSTEPDARNKVVFEYDTESGNLQVQLVGEDGSAVTQYNGPVNYKQNAGAVIPANRIRFLGVTFNTSKLSEDANPAYVDEIRIDLIPREAGQTAGR